MHSHLNRKALRLEDDLGKSTCRALSNNFTVPHVIVSPKNINQKTPNKIGGAKHSCLKYYLHKICLGSLLCMYIRIHLETHCRVHHSSKDLEGNSFCLRKEW